MGEAISDQSEVYGRCHSLLEAVGSLAEMRKTGVRYRGSDRGMSLSNTKL